MADILKRGRILGVGVLIVALAASGAACGDDDDGDDATGGNTPAAMATTPAGDTTPEGDSTPAEGGDDEEVLGETPGWAGGATGTVFYTQDFFCNDGDCETGNDGTNPDGVSEPVPTVWVLVPLFTETDGIELHCETAGECVAHPSEINVSSIGLGDVIPLPPHSHIIDPEEPGFSAAGETPWDVVVVGINTREAWDKVEAGKSLAALRAVQAEGEASATGDVPTDLLLFFGVRS